MEDFPEKYELMNELYKVIFSVISKYETRGFIAHQQTQTIVVKAMAECKEWIEKQSSDPAKKHV